MFVVVNTPAVPDHVKGYTDRFLVEVSPSMYVGNVSRRVADELWDVLVENRSQGHITMILSNAKTEQQYEVRVDGRNDVQMRDFDGLKLPAWSRKIAHHAH